MDKKLVEQLLGDEESQKRNPSPLWAQLRRNYKTLCGLENKLVEHASSLRVLSELKQAIEAAEKHHTDLNSDITALSAENEGERKCLQKELDAHHADILQLDEELRQVDEESARLQQEILQAEQRKPMRDRLLAKKADLAAKSEDLQQKIDAFGESYVADKALRDNLEKCVNDIEETESQMNALLEEIWGEKTSLSRDAFDRM